MGPTGTKLLGLVKHLASVEGGYLADTFGRPFPEPLPWTIARMPNDDMWAHPAECRDDIVALYRRVWQHSDVTVSTLELDHVGQVPWWPAERAEATLHAILVRMTAETSRHAGHADILRELIDGRAGAPPAESEWWEAYRARVEAAAQEAAAKAAGRQRTPR
jgi:hypothetical protein